MKALNKIIVLFFCHLFIFINTNAQIKSMYVAFSYDHRIIDGRESVSFLVAVKKMLEEPVTIMFEGGDAVKMLLGL